MDGQNFNNYQNNVGNMQQNSPQPSGGNSALAIVSLIAGILAIISGCCTGYVGIILGIVGIVCAAMSNKQGKSGLATGGLVCSIIGIVIGVIILILAAIGYGMMGYV